MSVRTCGEGGQDSLTRRGCRQTMYKRKRALEISEELNVQKCAIIVELARRRRRRELKAIPSLPEES